MKILFFFFVIFIFLHLQKKNNIIKEPFENPDENIYISCGNSYIIEDNIAYEPLNGLYTEILKIKYEDIGGIKNKVPICYKEIHPRNDKNYYDYFNGDLLENPMDLYSKPNETHKPILYGFDVDFIK